MTFEEIKINHIFNHNGTRWVKKSTRTAVLHSTNRVFYFSKKEIIYPFIRVDDEYYGS